MKTKPGTILIMNSAAAAMMAALAAQIFHETCHGIAAALTGQKWLALNLFAAQWDWRGAANTVTALIIEGIPALLNILVGLVAAFFFHRVWARRRPMLRLFLMYLAGYSVFMGFGYLLTDPLFYQRGGSNLGDWKKVVDHLGGSWMVRLPLIIIGGAGVLWGFFWLARAALRFSRSVTEKAERIRVALPLLLVPYLAINILFTILSAWHPLGGDGIFIVIFQYWFGYIGFFWAFFLAGYWLRIKASFSNETSLPEQFRLPWIITTGVLSVAAIAILLPTLWFS